MTYKLGLQPPVPGAVRLRWATYANYSVLPTPPESFGHVDMVADYGMLGNDSVGDCAVAGACHQTMLWCAEAGSQVNFSVETAIRNYSDITGYDPTLTAPDGSNPTDNGTAVPDLAKFWQRTGILDDAGNRHKILAYADLNPKDLRELWTATWLFQSVGIGFAMPDSAQRQFEAGEPWDVIPGAQIEGGHYVPVAGRHNAMGDGITWGRVHPFTERFFQKYCTQGLIALSEEMLVKAQSIDGIDDQLLRHDIASFAAS